VTAPPPVPTLDDTPLMHSYAPFDVCFVRGSGSWLWDDDGNEYLDCLGGIACSAVGHAHPAVTAAVADQAGTLVQTSMLFWNRPVVDLARRLHEITGWGRMFFANSGAEANECAIKLVRRWAGDGRSTIVCADGGFHGRTLATLAATGQPTKWAGFEPLPAGFVHAPYGDLDAFAAAVDDTTAAVMVETIQGEAGIIPGDHAFLAGLRELCDDRGIALIFDEIQTGVGRTGTWWSFQGLGVEPDVFTSAKALGNGLPIGVCIAREAIADAFGPGAHGSTFGGQAVPAAAALATLDVLEAEGLVPQAAVKGETLAASLADHPCVTHVRGRGLMLAAVLERPVAAGVVTHGLAGGLVVNAPAPDAVRFVPPLTISPDEIAEAARRFHAALDAALADEDGGAP
jgi:acetylornithine/N-succinyldiaminopimelate aminotransferase